MVVFQIARGFHLHETPKVSLAAFYDIYPDENSIVFKYSFEDSRDFVVSKQLSRGADRLIESAIAANFDAAGKSWRASMPTSWPCVMVAFGAAPCSAARSG